MNKYDHRIKEIVIASGDPTLFRHVGVNTATAKNWIYGRYSKPITFDDGIYFSSIKDREIEKLHREISKLKALVNLYHAVDKVVPLSLSKRNIKCREKRKMILSSVLDASKIVGLETATRFIGVSQSRYKRWRVGNQKCQISQSHSCVRRYPNQLSKRELEVIKNLVTSKKYAHMSSISLFHYARRKELLHCGDDTWYKYIDKYGWTRPFVRRSKKRFPDRVRIAHGPNEIIHIDITQIKVGTGKVYYLQTVLDNYSRSILGWELHSSPLASNSAQLVRKVLSDISGGQPTFPNRSRLVSDRGSENVNSEVKDALNGFPILHRLHKVDIRYSNNMLEVFFRSLKNNYLKFVPPMSKRDLLRRLRFYMKEHNQNVPLASLCGATPLERYLGTWKPPKKDEHLKSQEAARIIRLSENRSQNCFPCWEV